MCHHYIWRRRCKHMSIAILVILNILRVAVWVLDQALVSCFLHLSHQAFLVAIVVRLQPRLGHASEKIFSKLPSIAPRPLMPHTPRSTSATSPPISRTHPHSLSLKRSMCREERQKPLCIYSSRIRRLLDRVGPQLRDKWRHVRSPQHETATWL